MSKTFFYIFISAVFSGSMFLACENAAEPKNEEVLDFNSALIQSFDDEIKIIQKDKTILENGDAMFSLSWGKVKAPFLDLNFEIGHAMAIAFDEHETDRGYFHASGLNMGDVVLEMPSDTLKLNGINGRGKNYVYISTPKIEGRGRHGFNNFNFSIVPFEASSAYTFKTSGSVDVEAMTIGFKTPETLLSISNLSDGQSIDKNEDLIIKWKGGSAESQVLVALLPFHNPNGRPGKPGRSGHKKMKDEFKAGDFIRLDFENHPVIVEKLDANSGTFTITAAELSELVESIDAKSLMLHLAAIDFSTEEINTKLVNKIIRMNDRIVLEIE